MVSNGQLDRPLAIPELILHEVIVDVCTTAYLLLAEDNTQNYNGFCHSKGSLKPTV